jgi:hypothetical protein
MVQNYVRATRADRLALPPPPTLTLGETPTDWRKL